MPAFRCLCRILVALVLSVATLRMFAGAAAAQSIPPRTPIVLFPAFHFTRLMVNVQKQQVDPSCPASGSFEDWYPNPTPSPTFSRVCMDKLMTLRYDGDPSLHMPDRFSNQRGVTVTMSDYGTTASAPAYEQLYASLEQAGWRRDVSIRVAGYDSRLTPDMGGFLVRTRQLIEQTYAANGHRRVHLVGHSNGPLYAQYLLTHSSESWKEKYIQGFTPIAGNFPGQGAMYGYLFTGLNLTTFTLPDTQEIAESSARMLISAPSTYMSAAAPSTFGTGEVVIADAGTGKQYTPADYHALVTAPGMPPEAAKIADYYIGFVRFRDGNPMSILPASTNLPNVDVYAEKGSGIPTLVGVTLHDLTVGQVFDAALPVFTRDGDGNEEDITNNAIQAWSAMPCHHFTLTDNPGLDHFSLAFDSAVLSRLMANAQKKPSVCQS
ncbi:lipase/acyltransferase domain-containing protein [Microbispora sp. KK1-11]|uniref:lipase/acyltransferase domain-containing protein n=1 Tax=Microbispora sp. KK1-11 TaxID=2053005 RepID=UPI00115979E7|nr:hypothetical protein [Microbispora sp. KK1-11]TQS20837.1 hypothetical protein FLW16_40390 [Microbispora sp. KK1-11]